MPPLQLSPYTRKAALLAPNQRFPLCSLAYDAERDGWSAESFHTKVDTFGAAVVLARTAGGALCGGYNPRGWIGAQALLTLGTAHAWEILTYMLEVVASSSIVWPCALQRTREQCM